MKYDDDGTGGGNDDDDDDNNDDGDDAGDYDDDDDGTGGGNDDDDYYDVSMYCSHCQRGYTFIAEARTLNSILPAGKFRLRIIGSTEPLPYPPRESVNSNFVHKEIRDYYLPNKYNIIFR